MLKFVHITKNAGTSIENVAWQHDILWGRNDLEYLSGYKVQKEHTHTSLWHIPLKYFEENPYANHNVFAVIRNPFERVVSEFHCAHFGYHDLHCSVEKFNHWLVKKIEENTGSDHFAPQSNYIFDDQGAPLVEHLIRYESIDSDFYDLMRRYDLPVKLNRKDNSKSDRHPFTIEDLSQQTREKIFEYYRDDFELLGFAY